MQISYRIWEVTQVQRPIEIVVGDIESLQCLRKRLQGNSSAKFVLTHPHFFEPMWEPSQINRPDQRVSLNIENLCGEWHPEKVYRSIESEKTPFDGNDIRVLIRFETIP
uniref:Uncharacterized protein n=1 Tax=Paramoeba aestuarina TaxID=180227 RepID=A0A7S4KSV0_9EUKA|mmetsp:Transcript_24753/g.38571  ORF Transcript_24753/g.38571 Transcript_24753/m.38571 type:complete len:109 (+) Transcript_24753:291-617(+)